MNKEERTKRFKSMSSMQRQKLILKKMKERGIEVGSGIPNKKYDSKDIYESRINRWINYCCNKGTKINNLIKKLKFFSFFLS